MIKEKMIAWKGNIIMFSFLVFKEESFEYFRLYTNRGCLHTNIKICNIVNFQ